MNPVSERLPSFQILGSRVDAVDFDTALDRAWSLMDSDRAHQIVTANTLMFLAAETDPALRQTLDDASLVIPESWGIRWASRRVGRPLRQFIPGIDFMTALCARGARESRSVFLLGAKPEVAEAAGKQLTRRFPGLRIAGTHHGYFKDKEADVLKRIRDCAPSLLFAGLNVPFQDIWLHQHLKDLPACVAMGVGGSFDVLSGRLRRAPMWMRRVGIEWVYRTLQEPWRMQRIKWLPVFMWRVLKAGKPR